MQGYVPLLYSWVPYSGLHASLYLSLGVLAVYSLHTEHCYGGVHGLTVSQKHLLGSVLLD